MVMRVPESGAVHGVAAGSSMLMHVSTHRSETLVTLIVSGGERPGTKQVRVTCVVTKLKQLAEVIVCTNVTCRVCTAQPRALGSLWSLPSHSFARGVSGGTQSGVGHENSAPTPISAYSYSTAFCAMPRGRLLNSTPTALLGR